MLPLKFKLESCREENCKLERHEVTVPKKELIKFIREAQKEWYKISYGLGQTFIDFIDKNYKEGK